MKPGESTTPVRLYWEMADHFHRDPGDWRFLRTHWQVESLLPTKRRLSLHAVITAGLSFGTGKYTHSGSCPPR